MLRVPGSIRAKLKDELNIIVFDSWAGDRTYEISLVKKMILDEWRLKESHKHPKRIITKDTIPVIVPANQPQQPNTWDCGLYAVTNVEKMFGW